VENIKANGLIRKSTTKIQGEKAIVNVNDHYVSNSDCTSREYDQNCMKHDISRNFKWCIDFCELYLKDSFVRILGP
jgi:hypothetical protein